MRRFVITTSTFSFDFHAKSKKDAINHWLISMDMVGVPFHIDEVTTK